MSAQLTEMRLSRDAMCAVSSRSKDGFQHFTLLGGRESWLEIRGAAKRAHTS